MTRKHFNEMAGRLKWHKPDADASDETKAVWLKLVEEMAGMGKMFNGNFDRNRFMTACGVDAHEV